MPTSHNYFARRHRNVIFLHVDIILLYVEIIYLSCRGAEICYGNHSLHVLIIFKNKRICIEGRISILDVNFVTIYHLYTDVNKDFES